MGGDSINIICGPTAAGKSAVGMALARESGAAIISADSRQIYRRFNIGTAKPGAEERRDVQHFGVDIVDATERYSAATWGEEAAGWITTAESTPTGALVIGGTGLYLRALVQPLAELPYMEPSARAALERDLTARDISELRRWCRELDPDRAEMGKTQLVRSIETALLTGQCLSEIHRAHNAKASRNSPATPRYLLVDPGQALSPRIEQRVDAMLESGWLAEVRDLMDSVPGDAPAWKASGYRTMRDVARGALDLSSARERIIIEVRQYAKRQRTWFRNQLPANQVTSLDPDSPGAMAIARDWFSKGRKSRL